MDAVFCIVDSYLEYSIFITLPDFMTKLCLKNSTQEIECCLQNTHRILYFFRNVSVTIFSPLLCMGELKQILIQGTESKLILWFIKQRGLLKALMLPT